MFQPSSRSGLFVRSQAKKRSSSVLSSGHQSIGRSAGAGLGLAATNTTASSGEAAAIE